MSWIKVEDKFALEALPDPAQLLDADGFKQQIAQKQQEVTMYGNEIVHLTERKETLETEITEMQDLIQGD